MLQQALRFLVTGGVNTAFGYGLYAACIYLGAGYALASGVSIACGVLFSYRTMSALVFGQGGSLTRYIASYGVVYLFSVLFLKILDDLGVNAYVSGLLAALPCAALSFALLKLFVFRPVQHGPVDRRSGL